MGIRCSPPKNYCYRTSILKFLINKTASIFILFFSLDCIEQIHPCKALEERVPFFEERDRNENQIFQKERGRNEMLIFEERKKERIRSFSRSI